MGSTAAKKSPVGTEYIAYMYRFCGLPTGVAMLPRFAATVWSTMTGMSRSVRPMACKISTAKGTNVMSETSFVTSIEVKNGSSTSIIVTRRRLPRPVSSLWAITAKSPQPFSPSTTAMRQNSRHRTRRSM